MKDLTNQAWYSFEKPWGCYRLLNGELWKRAMDAQEIAYGEPEKIEDVRGYEHIIEELKWFLR